MKRILISIILVSALIYVVVGIYLYSAQRSFIYYPVKSSASHLDQIVFQNQGESISASVLNAGKRQAIVYFGGNAENVDFNDREFSAIFADHTVYLIKYRGYGSSTGQPDEEGLYSDSLYIYDAVSQSHDSISVIGRSLGSGIATYLATNRKIEKLVLITPFDSIQSVAQKMFPLFPLSLLLKDKYDSLSRAGSIKADTLVIAAEHDQIIGINHTKRLVNKIDPVIIRVEIFPGRGHNDLYGFKEYYELLDDFMYGDK